MAVDLARYRELFFTEARSRLQVIAQSLQQLESNVENQAALYAAFRAAHTIKGMSATMGYDDITSAAHGLEDLLSSMQKGLTPAGPASVRLLARAFNELSRRVAHAEVSEMPGNGASESAGPELAPAPIPEPPTAMPINTGLLAEASEATPYNVRVRQHDLDLLLELVAELAVSSNALERLASAGSQEAVLRQHRQRMRELQALAWQLNMAPLGEVFSRFPRMLHELAREQGKAVRVLVEGQEVELCHTLLDELHEPLLHLVRNAVAHGLEPPAERAVAGKEPYGLVRLSAAAIGDRATIRVADDGRGLDAARILQTAYAQGLISNEQRYSMSETDAFRLILLPGFSMSHTVTSVSGRGVGMNVVINKLDAIGGRLDIESQVGQGTVFILDVPRLVALAEVELVRQGSRVYAIPTSQIARTYTVRVAELVDRDASGKAVLIGRRRLYDFDTLLLTDPAQLDLQAEYGVLAPEAYPEAALRVDELLGKALLNDPPPAGGPITRLDLVSWLSR